MLGRTESQVRNVKCIKGSKLHNFEYLKSQTHLCIFLYQQNGVTTATSRLERIKG